MPDRRNSREDDRTNAASAAFDADQAARPADDPDRGTGGDRENAFRSVVPKLARRAKGHHTGSNHHTVRPVVHAGGRSTSTEGHVLIGQVGDDTIRATRPRRISTGTNHRRPFRQEPAGDLGTDRAHRMLPPRVPRGPSGRLGVSQVASLSNGAALIDEPVPAPAVSAINRLRFA